MNFDGHGLEDLAEGELVGEQALHGKAAGGRFASHLHEFRSQTVCNKRQVALTDRVVDENYGMREGLLVGVLVLDDARFKKRRVRGPVPSASVDVVVHLPQSLEHRDLVLRAVHVVVVDFAIVDFLCVGRRGGKRERVGDVEDTVVVDALDLASNGRWQRFTAVLDDAERREGVDADFANLTKRAKARSGGGCSKFQVPRRGDPGREPSH